jgi:hypothetical protein
MTARLLVQPETGCRLFAELRGIGSALQQEVTFRAPGCRAESRRASNKVHPVGFDSIRVRSRRHGDPQVCDGRDFVPTIASLRILICEWSGIWTMGWGWGCRVSRWRDFGEPASRTVRRAFRATARAAPRATQQLCQARWDHLMERGARSAPRPGRSAQVASRKPPECPTSPKAPPLMVRSRPSGNRFPATDGSGGN